MFNMMMQLLLVLFFLNGKSQTLWPNMTLSVTQRASKPLLFLGSTSRLAW